MSTQSKGGSPAGKGGPGGPGKQPPGKSPQGKSPQGKGAAAREARVSERRQQVEAMRKAQARRERLRVSALITGTALVAVVVIVLAIVFSGGSGSGGKANPANVETGPNLLATAANSVQGETVDGIKCDPNEQLVTHVHAHVAIYVDGKAKLIPYGIGIPNPVVDTSSGTPFAGAPSGGCYYWLHTHDDSGIVHVESPSKTAVYTLGDLFDEWKQPLTSGQIGPAKGAMTMEINGKPYTGDPRKIPLTAHNVIQISVGKAVPFKNYTFSGGL